MTTLLSLVFFAQAQPVDISKTDLPKLAACVVCASNGETGEEKPAAGVRYKEKAYYFCNAKEVAEFKKDPESFMPPVLPRPVPAFRATSLDGKEVSLGDYRGKVVLIDFWATWCAPCVKAMPDVEKLYKKFSDQGFVTLGVSIDEDQKKAREFQAKRRFSYPILLDDVQNPSWAAFKVKAIPAIFLLDREGQIIAQWKGEPKIKEIEAALKNVLEQKG